MWLYVQQRNFFMKRHRASGSIDGKEYPLTMDICNAERFATGLWVGNFWKETTGNGRERQEKEREMEWITRVFTRPTKHGGCYTSTLCRSCQVVILNRFEPTQSTDATT